VTNNIILKKLRVAFELKEDDMHAILKAVNFPVSKPELSALFRKVGHTTTARAATSCCATSSRASPCASWLMQHTVSPVGFVRSCFKEKFAIPRQPQLAPAARACWSWCRRSTRAMRCRGWSRSAMSGCCSCSTRRWKTSHA
jgi:hypothetical protein